MRRFAMMILSAALLVSAPAAVRPLVIGDSQSEEYVFEFPFSAPDSSPLDANTRNWIEILAAHRPAAIDFGSYRPILFSYPDLRNAGFASNFGIPAAEFGTWRDIAEATIFGSFEFWTTRLAILDQLEDADGAGNYATDLVVIFLGGNVVNSDYGDLYNDAPRPGFFTNPPDELTAIINLVRSPRPAIPIILVNIPDVGAAPDIQADHPDPLKRATASGHIAALNGLLTDIAIDQGATVVDLFSLTQQIIAPEPVFLGAIPLVKAGAPENPPDHLFCKDGFHPSTVAQALIANAILEGINAALGTSAAPMTSREILADVLGLNPDQPYLDWIASFPGANPAMDADDDRDGLPQIGEFALQGHPLRAGDLPAPAPTANGASLTFTLDPLADRLVETIPEESLRLESWTPVPAASVLSLPGNTIEAQLPAGPAAHARLRFALRP